MEFSVFFKRCITTCACFWSINAARSKVRESEAAFWKNYFYHCEQARKGHFGKKSLVADENKPIDDDRTRRNVLEKLGTEESASASEQAFINKDDSSLDDSSLVPASVTDDSSYVNIIPSAPNSINTAMTTRSIEDLVLIDRDGGDNNG